MKEAAEKCKSAEVYAQSMETSLEDAQTRCAAAEEAAAGAMAVAESANSAAVKLQQEVRHIH